MEPGELLFSLNYEADPEGYPRRIDGFERFDGRTRPSEATYYVVEFQYGSDDIDLGITITGDTSGDTGKVVGVIVNTGTLVGGEGDTPATRRAISCSHTRPGHSMSARLSQRAAMCSARSSLRHG